MSLRFLAPGPKPRRERFAAARAAGLALAAALQLAAALAWAESADPVVSTDAESLTVLAALGLAAALILSLLARELRGKGDVSVTIDYPAERRGSFSVRLSRRRPRPARRAPGGAAARAEEPASRASTRLEHTLVARETQFRAVPARQWHVALEGVLEGAAGRETVREERSVRVLRGRTVRVDFDLKPRECSLEVRILRSGEPARGARIALGGDPTSLRFVRDGVTRLTLPAGEHRLRVGCEDRAAERKLLVESLEPQSLAIDLDDEPGLVFQGCEGAVEPFLQGDLAVTASALERGGQQAAARVLRARFHQARGETRPAAELLELAGSWFEAAELHAETGSYERAAALFERAGDHARAAEMYNATGDLLRAGRAYEQAGDLEAAAVCYRDADALPRLIEVLEKKGDHFEAGRLSLERHEATRALRNLQQVDARHPRYVETCRILAEILAEQGKLDLAVQRAEESLAFGGSDGSSPASIVWYGDLLDRAGRTERALQVLEELAGRAPEHPDLGSRIEELRKKLSAARRQGAAVTSPAAGPAGASRYEILEELGRGGMGVVHKARDRRLGRVVALKRLPATFKDHPHALELFLREARSAAALNHQNIVTIHDVDQDEDGSVFLTMELLEGTSLHHMVRRRGRLEPLDAARLAMQIAAGLHYAHENRIIHRDIKAANLFFTKTRVLKIMDFGLAKTLEEVRKASTLIGGTPFYMAPEQVRGGVVDHRVDLYAFGVTLFEMLTGSVPFRDGDVLYHHCHTAPPDPRSLAPGMPDELAELVLQLLAKNPEARPASAAEVGQRLQGIVDMLRAARAKQAEPAA